MLLQDDRMTVAGRELHDGVEAWVIRLRPVEGEAEWTLWVSAADGKPLELRDPGRDGQAAQVIRWSTYEVLPGSAANRSPAVADGCAPGRAGRARPGAGRRRPQPAVASEGLAATAVRTTIA